MARDNNKKVPRAGKLPLGSYLANFEWKRLIQFHQQHFSFNHGPDTAITTSWMAQDCQLPITLQSLHRLICSAQNVSASALGLRPLWILLKVDLPNPAGCDKQTTSSEPKSWLLKKMLVHCAQPWSSFWNVCRVRFYFLLISVHLRTAFAQDQTPIQLSFILGWNNWREHKNWIVFVRPLLFLSHPKPGPESLHVSSDRYQSGQNWAGFCRL